MPLSERVDIGLKYRHFRTGRVSFEDTLTSPEFYTGDLFDLAGRGRISTHSVLASLMFNLGGAPVEPAPVVEAAPPPPPPPAPATQTCPDGSVILATDVCPPPPPPPPPPPAPERG